MHKFIVPVLDHFKYPIWLSLARFKCFWSCVDLIYLSTPTLNECKWQPTCSYTSAMSLILLVWLRWLSFPSSNQSKDAIRAFENEQLQLVIYWQAVIQRCHVTFGCIKNYGCGKWQTNIVNRSIIFNKLISHVKNVCAVETIWRFFNLDLSAHFIVDA